MVCFMYRSSSSTSAGHIEIDRSSPLGFQERSRKKKKLACESIEVDKALLSSLHNLQRDQSEDEAGSFGEHVASRLRHFTNRQRAIACIEINKLLLKIEFPNDPYFNPHSSHYNNDYHALHPFPSQPIPSELTPFQPTQSESNHKY